MKYIIDVSEDRIKDGKLNLYAEVESVLPTRIQTGIKCEPYTEPDLNPLVDEAVETIENEVWSLAREIAYCMSLQECEDAGMVDEDDIYDDAAGVLEKLNYQEAKARYDAWKKQRAEIHVGDEVIPMDTEYDTMIVTRTWKDGYDESNFIDTIGFDGSICSFFTSKVKKTGRHFDEVKELLKKMKEEEE